MMCEWWGKILRLKLMVGEWIDRENKIKDWTRSSRN